MVCWVWMWFWFPRNIRKWGNVSRIVGVAGLGCSFHQTILDIDLNHEPHSPPIDLHLIFEKSSLKNQVGQTFLSISNLIFTACVACKIQVQNRLKTSSFNLIFQTSLLKIKCRSISWTFYIFSLIFELHFWTWFFVYLELDFCRLHRQ